MCCVHDAEVMVCCVHGCVCDGAYIASINSLVTTYLSGRSDTNGLYIVQISHWLLKMNVTWMYGCMGVWVYDSIEYVSLTVVSYSTALYQSWAKEESTYSPANTVLKVSVCVCV